MTEDGQTDHMYCQQATADSEQLYQQEGFGITKPDGTAVESNIRTKSNRICCVPECHTTGYAIIPGYGKPSYHGFPRPGDPLRSVWLHKIRRDEGPHFKVTCNTVVCCLHFEKEVMETSGFAKRTYLNLEL